jgi:hypothetical protein
LLPPPRKLFCFLLLWPELTFVFFFFVIFLLGGGGGGVKCFRKLKIN